MTEENQPKSGVEAIVTGAFEVEGYVIRSPKGLRRDIRARNEAVLAAFDGREANTKLDKAEAAITRGELYQRVFANGPGASGSVEELDEEQRLAYERLKRDCWALTQPGPDGWIQRQLAASGSSLVLCRAKVMRGADPVIGAYLTNDPTLIMEDAVAGQIEALVRKADHLRRHMEMVLTRHPELQDRVFSEIGHGMNRTAAALPAATKSDRVTAIASARGRTSP